MRGQRLIVCVVLALILVLMSSLPAFAQEPPLADIESEIDVVQWGVVYCPKEGCEEYLEALKLLVVLEIADLFVERAMIEYAEAGEVTDRVERCLNRALAWLERATALSDDGGFDISASIDKAIETEVFKEERLGKCGWLSGGDTPWTGESMGAYGNCTTVDSYIDVTIARISLWPLEQL
jgi:hypothetical protein